MLCYAHSYRNSSPQENAEYHKEPLFTPFGDSENQCQGSTCQKCEVMEPMHGHLNKVAYRTAKFAAEMFSQDSADSTEA